MSHSEFIKFIDLIKKGGSDEEINLKMKEQFFTMKDKYNCTVLHRLAGYNRIPFIIPALKLGSDIDAQNKLKNTPIHHAAYNGHVEILKILVDHGAQIDLIGEKEETPLQAAQNNGKTAAAEYLSKIESEILQAEQKLLQCAIEDDLNQFQQLFTNKFHLFIVDSKTKLTLYETLQINGANKIINFFKAKPITLEDLLKLRKLFNQKNRGFMRALETNPLAKFFVSREILDFEEHVCVENVNKITALNFKYPIELANIYGSRLVMEHIPNFLKDDENKDEEEKIEIQIKEIEIRKVI